MNAPSPIYLNPASQGAHNLIAHKLAQRLFVARLHSDDQTWFAYARQELTSALETARHSAATSREPSTVSTAIIAGDIVRAISTGTRSPLWQEHARIVIATMLASMCREAK
jgi:hypothetical protein